MLTTHFFTSIYDPFFYTDTSGSFFYQRYNIAGHTSNILRNNYRDSQEELDNSLRQLQIEEEIHS